MSDIILPPDSPEMLIMGDAYKNALTPKLSAEKRAKEADAERNKSDGKFKYASSAIAMAPGSWIKTSQSSGVNNIMTEPSWFSPLHTAQNWQIASKRREVMQWCRFFYESEPKVGAAIDFYCFTPDTQILMSNGQQKSISSVKPGEYVRSHDGSVNKVIRKFSRTSNEQILKIYISGLTTGPLKTTPNHKILVERNGAIDFIDAKELTDNDYLLTPCGYNNCVSKDISVDNNFAWLLGIYAAEGCGIPYEHFSKDGKLEKHFKGVKFTLNLIEKDTIAQEIVTKIKKIYGDCKISVKNIAETNTCIVSAYGRDIADDLHGLCPGTSSFGTKRLIPYVMKWHKDNLMHLLSGFLSGDGCFNKHNGFHGVGVCKSLCEQISSICSILSIEHSLTKARVAKDNKQTCYNVRISRRACSRLQKITSKVYDYSINEKFIRNIPYFVNEKYIYRKIRKIEKEIYNGDLYDLEIENQHSYVANQVSVHNSQFPMNGFELECKKKKIIEYYKHYVVNRLNLNEIFKQISKEYFMLGDVFIHLDVDCPICKGSAINPETNQQCDHPDGAFKRVVILNPDWIEVKKTSMVDEAAIVMIPDEELTNIVHKREPKAIFDRIPMWIKKLVAEKKPIPLSPRTVSHLKHMPVPYGPYGTSLIRRLFTILAYKTKLMSANWIVAERLILPVRVVKIGSDDRPATSADIIDIQQQIAATANDPNLTIVTHHNFSYDWYGSSGKILQVTQEMDFISKEILDGFMLNQALLNGEMCIPEADRMLTKDGLKNLSQVSKDDEIATFNKETGMLEYQKPTAIHVYDWDGDLIHFQTDRIDFACTPNHRMLYQKRDHDEWIVDTADTLKDRDKFRKTVDWVGNLEAKQVQSLRIHGHDIPFSDFLKIIAYYVSEGHIQKETRKTRSTYKKPQSVHLSQTEKGKGWTDLIELSKDATYNVCKTRHGFAIHDTHFAQWMSATFGELSHNKKIPAWIKNQPKEELRQLLGYLINGDGCLRTRDKSGPKKYYAYFTKSDHLRDDVIEIALKCGYFPRFRKRRNIWEITFSDYDLGQETIPLESKKYKTKTRMPYKGKVWCVAVPNSFIITERNGKLMISGNSGYQSANVGVETLIRRIESWRHTLAEWCEKNIFLPIAEMQGFIDEEKSRELGETCYLYPKIKWNDLQLRDQTTWHNMLFQLHQTQVISTQTLMEKFGLDYDQEVKRMRHEQLQSGAGMGNMGAGAGGMGGAGAGGMGGAGGDMGAGGAGGMPMNPMDGGMGAGGIGLGGPAGAMGGGDMGAAAGASPMKITKKGKGGNEKEQHQVQTPMIKLTRIEQEMANMLLDVASNTNISSNMIKAQFPVQNPGGGKPFMIDFAIPQIKLGMECDGEIYHSTEEQEANDKERDFLLAQKGWTILRFDDKSIDDAPHAIKQTIAQFIMKLRNKNKTASTETIQPHLFTSNENKLIRLIGEESYDKYFSQIDERVLNNSAEK